MASWMMILCIFLLGISLLVQDVYSTTFTIKNGCLFTVWPGTLTGSGAPLSVPDLSLVRELAGQSMSRHIGLAVSGLDGDVRMPQEASSVNLLIVPQLQCNDTGGTPPATLVEFTLNGAGNEDFYDISNVDGFNLPVSIVPQRVMGCSSVSCDFDINSRCPQELRAQTPDGTVVGCKSACLTFNTDAFCCRGSYGSSTSCRPSTYSSYFKQACPQAYSYTYDDASSTFTCTGADYVITFCPASS